MTDEASADTSAGDAEASPPDSEARDRIETDIDTTLFVEAGAGSGKTRALVDRVLKLVTSGTADIDEIAAITFTEKAAAELRDRIRTRLEEKLADRPAEGPVARRCRRSRDQLDGAAIGTLHGFARRLLARHPLEVGLPPRIEVLDEVTSGIEFERRWSAFRDELLDEPDLARTLRLLVAIGVDAGPLRVMAERFNANWDLVAEQVPVVTEEPPPVGPAVEQVIEALNAVLQRRHECTAPGDTMLPRLEQLDAYATMLGQLWCDGDEPGMLAALNVESGATPSFNVGNCGNRSNWPDTPIAEVRAQIVAIAELANTQRRRIAEVCAKRIGSEIRRFTLTSTAERRDAGRLEFHDLLVLARALLRGTDIDDGAAAPTGERRSRASRARTELAGTYRHILLDEFQDTDPIQIELAVRLAAEHPGADAAGSAPWNEIDLRAGALFVVGDPKQSIYRFRRADVGLFLAAQQWFGDERSVALTTNFRSGADILDWINVTFGELIRLSHADDSPDARVTQPHYLGLRANRTEPATGPPVSVIGRSPHEVPYKSHAKRLRDAEAADVAAVVRRAVTEGWSVTVDNEDWRAAELGDIAILVPTRTSLDNLEDALTGADVPYRTEASSLVYSSRAVRDVLMALRAVADPTDALSVVSTLRTPLFACSDDDLVRFRRHHGGTFSYQADRPDTLGEDDPVAVGLATLARWHRRHRWTTPSALLDQVIRERRAMELGFAEGRPRDVWRRLRFVQDQARAWCDAGGGGLRDYLAWVAHQSEEGARVSEAVLPETDDRAVRIMTIHAAKGLEFPITIVSGSSTEPRNGRAHRGEPRFPPSGEVAYQFGKDWRTEAYEASQPIDEQMSYEERIRLLYVATTRARDHLVVSLHRRVRSEAPDPTNLTNAELLVKGCGERLDQLPDAVDGTIGPRSHAGDEGPPEQPRFADRRYPFHEWRVGHQEAIASAQRPTTVAATALSSEGTPDGGAERPPATSTPDEERGDDSEPVPDDDADEEPTAAGLAKRERNLDLWPWHKGRYGTAVGRAVHGVLQTVDLATGDGLEAAVIAQCQAEAITEGAEDVAARVRHALDAPVIAEAAAAPHWRELYACTPIGAGGRLLEGYVDLLHRSPAGLVVTDYKTAPTGDPHTLDDRVAAYRLQGGAYALAVHQATGEPVTRVCLLFLTPDGPVERDLADLDDLTAHVAARIEAGDEVLADESTDG